jgi:GalNAc-alpha-(1->4)-GalNAc-alpha-(1->3)-diNAcBac-PP-undecaprenol alpha-1,4-N-acetyl-D-galactosaminyltransferase
MSNRRHIVMVTSTLAGGGAERVLVTMAEYWAGAGQRVTVLVLRAPVPGEYSVSIDVRVDRLILIDERNPICDWRQFTRLARLRARLKELRPDVVISFIDKLNTAVLVALTGSNIPVIATEHLAPWMCPLPPVWEALRHASYRRALCVVSPTAAITEWFTHRYKGPFETLPYPAKLNYAEKSLLRRNVILGVGRLNHQKGFDLLINAFAQIASRFPDWEVEIAGDGPLRGALDGQIAALGLTGRVRLLGQVHDVFSLYKSAEIFALPSRHEAYPMALCEALSAGCCVVASDCPTGPREILERTRAGVLVPSEDVESLATAIANLVAARDRPSAAGSAEPALVRQLDAPNVMMLWENALTRWLPCSR